jgi:hypothetical protein
MRELGRRATGPGRIYLVGGASALLEGWRTSTVDVDLKLDPEPPGIFEAIASIKNELGLNIELSAPDQFLPTLPDWRERSRFIGRYGQVEFFHYDFRAQALAKIARDHERDRLDVEAMLARGLVSLGDLASAFELIEPYLIRFPGLDARVLGRRVRTIVESDVD